MLYSLNQSFDYQCNIYLKRHFGVSRLEINSVIQFTTPVFYFLTHNWAHYGHKPSALKNDLLSAFLIQSNLKEYFINNIHRLYIYVSHTSLNSISYCLEINKYNGNLHF